MTLQGEKSVLRRKATAQSTRGMSPRRALRLALSQVSERMFGEPVIVSGISRWRADHDAFLNRIEDSPLITTIANPEGVTGAVVLDLQLTSALVEAQTLGTILSRPASVRATTRTDAAICLPLIDEMMQGFEAELQQHKGSEWPLGFRFSEWMAEKRAVALALTDLDYDVFRVAFELGTEGRNGLLLLALPVAESQIDEPPDEASKPNVFRQQVLAAPVTLHVNLHSIHASLAEVAELTIGDTFELPISALFQATLTSSSGADRIAEGQLGQCRGRWGFQVDRLAQGDQPKVKMDPARVPKRRSDVSQGADDTGMMTEKAELKMKQAPSAVDDPNADTAGELSQETVLLPGQAMR